MEALEVITLDKKNNKKHTDPQRLDSIEISKPLDDVEIPEPLKDDEVPHPLNGQVILTSVNLSNEKLK